MVEGPLLARHEGDHRRFVRLGARRPKRRSKVQVRGCGCCLPLALALMSAPVVVLRLLWRALR